MPYKRKDVYYVDLRPPGYLRRIGPLSTRQTRKDTAKQMEATLRELALTGRHGPLDALLAGQFTLTDLHAAKCAGALAELTENRTDRSLERVLLNFVADHGRRYRPIVRRILKQAPPGARLSWLTDPENVREIVRQYRCEGLAPSTERREVCAISLLLREQLGEAKRSEVMRRVKLRRVKDARTRWLDTDEIRRVRSAAGDWWVVIALALGTGIRRGELLNLTVRDLDLQAGTLIVQGGKSGRARRMLPLSGELPALLKGWIAVEGLQPNESLFPRPTGSRLRAAWEQIREAAGIIDVRWNDLRHTYAVHCAKAGMPLVELQQRLGHATIAMTMRYATYCPPVASTHTDLALEAMGLGEVPTPAPTGTPSTTESLPIPRTSSAPFRVPSIQPPAEATT